MISFGGGVGDRFLSGGGGGGGGTVFTIFVCGLDVREGNDKEFVPLRGYRVLFDAFNIGGGGGGAFWILERDLVGVPACSAEKRTSLRQLIFGEIRPLDFLLSL